MRLLFPALGVALSACNTPQYTWKQPPPAAAVGVACYEDARLALGEATVSWTRNMGNPTTVSRSSTGELVLTQGTAQTEVHTARGVAVYRGRQQLGAVEGLALVDDELASQQQAILDETAFDAAAYPVTAGAAVLLAGAGTLIVGVSGAWVLADPSSESDVPAYSLLGGVGLLGVSLIPAVAAWLELPGAVRHERDERMIVDPTIIERATAAIRAHDDALARQCGVRG